MAFLMSRCAAQHLTSAIEIPERRDAPGRSQGIAPRYSSASCNLAENSFVRKPREQCGHGFIDELYGLVCPSEALRNKELHEGALTNFRLFFGDVVPSADILALWADESRLQETG